LNKDKEISENKIRLCSLENNSFNDIKEITKETLSSIENDIKEVNLYNNHFIIYIYFQLSLLEFDKMCENLKNIPTSSINLNKFITDNDIINTNRIIFNLLTSFKFYIDSSKRHLIKQFGKENLEVSQFIGLTNKYYDNHFSYRFLEKLRNYTIHSNFPINMIPYSAKENNLNPEKMIGNLKLIVKRDDLLNEKSYLNAKVIKDLTEMTTDIDIEPLINELGGIILKIEKYIFSLHQNELENSISNLNFYARKYKNDNNEISIIYNISQNGNKISATTIKIPFDRIDEIENFKNF